MHGLKQFIEKKKKQCFLAVKMILSVVNIQEVEECETQLVDIQLADFLAPWLHRLRVTDAWLCS